jgi:hypothetical protein
MTTPKSDPQTPAQKFLFAARFADFGVLPSAAARDAGIPGIPALERPAWVIRCGEKVSCALFPNFREGPSFEAKGSGYDGGFAQGLIYAGLKNLNDVFEKLKPWPKSRLPTESEMRGRLYHLFGENGDWLFDLFKDDGAEFFAGVKEYESKLTLTEAANYHQGHADAIRMVAGENKKNDATEICLFMMLFWRVVDRLESVDQLHQVLTKVFGRNRVGYDVKRVAQICQRVGKRYRGCGRPRKQPQAPWRLR